MVTHSPKEVEPVCPQSRREGVCGVKEDLEMVTHSPKAVEPFCPLSRWEGVCGVKEDEEVGDVAAMAELLRIGTRVVCRSMHPMYHHQRRSHSLPELTLRRGFLQGGWIVRPDALVVGRQIGLGSVGAVYKGTCVSSGMIVAVKVSELPNPSASARA